MNGGARMNDQDWMLDVLTRSSREPEPAWTPDKATIAAGGRRRRRLRTVSVGGGAVGALAVTAAVVIGLGGIVGAGSAAPGPGTPKSTSVFDYAAISVSGSGKGPSNVLPVSAVDKMSGLIDVLDPAHSHLRSMVSASGFPHLHYQTAADGNSSAMEISTITASSVYTTDGKVPVPAVGSKAPNGSLSIMFAATSDRLGRNVYDEPDVSRDNIPCGYALLDAFQSTPPAHAPHWSKCTSTVLPDGSKVDSSSTPDGDGTVTMAVREYPNNGGGIAVVWTDYASWKTTLGADLAQMDRAPDPSVVLKPNPFSEQELAVVLSDPSLGPTSKPKASGNGPKQFLKTSDLGADATYDPASSSGGTGDLPMDNGCDYKDVNPLAKQGRMARYTVTAPGAKKVVVSELEYPLPAGTGPSTMATARSQAKGGCDQHGSLYSKDTVKDLPKGIGDEAFVENGVGTGTVTVWMRFGDTILRVDITQGQAMPDLSAPTDQAWLSDVAKAAASHWTAKD
ncbi:hypothetical protein [Catenulispora rubra]|uniref:hypothetical protein n=1 Tax=Catenulispora rubra TaxID=280293 RepID=UPI0018927C48|nr:hypothetical protein [Catenulispora rubra]